MSGFLFDIVDLVFMSKLSSNVTEEDIRENLNVLKKQVWFQNYLIDERTRHLIVYDQDVRHLIGKCRTKRMNKQFYEQRYEKKFARMIQSKLAR